MQLLDCINTSIINSSGYIWLLSFYCILWGQFHQRFYEQLLLAQILKVTKDTNSLTKDDRRVK